MTSLCVWCDKQGRKNAVKITCSTCEKTYHRTCLTKGSLWDDKDMRNYRKYGNFECWACTVPKFNDSFWSLPPPPPTPPPTPPRARQRRGGRDAVRVLSFNARSLKDTNKAAQLLAFFQTHSADIVAVNETWLTKNVRTYEVVPKEYVVLRKDREVERGGGVLLAIRPHL